MRLKGNQENPVIMLGLGLDAQDDHQRLTRGDNFLLCGGTEETHEKMTEVAIRVNEKLRKRGKTLNDTSPEELSDIISESGTKA